MNSQKSLLYQDVRIALPTIFFFFLGYTSQKREFSKSLHHNDRLYYTIYYIVRTMTIIACICTVIMLILFFVSTFEEDMFDVSLRMLYLFMGCFAVADICAWIMLICLDRIQTYVT